MYNLRSENISKSRKNICLQLIKRARKCCDFVPMCALLSCGGVQILKHPNSRLLINDVEVFVCSRNINCSIGEYGLKASLVTGSNKTNKQNIIYKNGFKCSLARRH